MRIGIFGGSFNPIHKGHLGLAEWIVREGFVDEVWLMISPHNPLKEQDGLLAENERLRLAKMATENVKGVKASDFEFSLPRPSYTYHTLTELSRTYPQDDFCLIIGADNWQVFPRWKNHEELIENYPILIFPRKGCDFSCEGLPKNVILMNAPLFPVSSTEIREKIKRGESLTCCLPESVLSEIRKKGFYR